MVLSKHIDVYDLEYELLKKQPKVKLTNQEEYINVYDAESSIPLYDIPEQSSSEEIISKQLAEKLSLDGNPTLNLASFVNTHISANSLKLITENITKNLADNDEYPSLIDIQTRCISILSNLWNAPSKVHSVTGKKVTNSIGTATTGSSEAIMLAGLALKKRWQEKRKAEGKSIAEPNIIMATCAQVALEKFARYFDVENRLVPVTEESGHLIDVSKIKENIDENTIGIFVIVGSTFTGSFEPVEQISNLLDEVEKETGYDIRIHVDGASGAFVAPFVFPHLKWDFSIPRVDSINTSGHKFGLTSCGLGWVIWKDADLLPQSLKFNLDYLGGVEETFGLNFSRPGFPVITQYYNFLTLGREGYRKVFDGCLSNARLLSNFLEGSKYFDVVSVIHHTLTQEEQKATYTKLDDQEFQPNEQYKPGLPVVAFTFSKEIQEKYPELPQSIFSSLLRKRGYIIPNYHLPPNENEKEILRVVVRNSLSLGLLERLLQDCVETMELLIDAAERVREITSESNVKGSAANTLAVHELLVAIASGGEAAVHEEKLADVNKLGDNAGKDKNSYRGIC
ncbi:Glutamate decarboxylase [Spathaspora sp. JA1]|nr:Glutamate decarboxylase [Spathaspora sp. JA1]